MHKSDRTGGASLAGLPMMQEVLPVGRSSSMYGDVSRGGGAHLGPEALQQQQQNMMGSAAALPLQHVPQVHHGQYPGPESLTLPIERSDFVFNIFQEKMRRRRRRWRRRRRRRWRMTRRMLRKRRRRHYSQIISTAIQICK